MTRPWSWLPALAMLAAMPAHAQQRAADTDSAWAAALLPVLRPLVPLFVPLAVGADSADARSTLLASTLASALGVPGPGAPVLRPGRTPDCVISSASDGPARERGETAWVRWHPGESADRGVLAISFSCRMNGRPFGHGVEQRVVRGPDGRWRAVGKPGGWTS